MKSNQNRMHIAALAMLAGLSGIASSDTYTVRIPSYDAMPQPTRTRRARSGMGWKKYQTRRSGRKSSRARALGML